MVGAVGKAQEGPAHMSSHYYNGPVLKPPVLTVDLLEKARDVTGPSVWQWPDHLSDGDFVEWGLRQLDWSNQRFADYLGVNRPTVSLWTNGHQRPKPWVKRTLKMLILLRLNVEVLV